MIDTKRPSVEFTAQDRCDRCSARAIALATLSELELAFCGHHLKKHHLALEMTGWEFSYDYDELDKITPPHSKVYVE